MAGIKALVGLAFMGSVAVLLLILGCALPTYNNWWPFFVVAFYALSPLPTLFAKRFSEDYDSSSSPLIEFCYFLTTGIVFSAFMLPIILARAPSGTEGDHVIKTGACMLASASNIVMFLTILGFFMAFGDDNDGYGHVF